MIDLRRLFSKATPVTEDDGRFGFAVVGLGRIAEHFLKGVADSSSVKVTALVSGDPAKAAKLAKKFGVGYTCGYRDFNALRDRAEVQAVYLALPVSLHREFVSRAAQAGKHVLVEKPMASDVAGCRAMIEDCRAADVVLSVAYRCPFDPMHQKLRSLIREGALGKVERFESTFGFKLPADDWRFNAALAGGGSAYDVGVYPLNAARFLLDEEPEIVSATATRSASGMETSIAWTMRFPGGVEAECKSSYVEEMKGALLVRGTAGEIALDPGYTHRVPVRMRGWYTDPASGKRVEVDEAAISPSHFRLEAEHVAVCAREGVSVVTSGEDALRDMELIAQMYAMAEVE